MGYIVSGMKASGLPDLGRFIYPSAFIGVVTVSFLMAPVGARWRIGFRSNAQTRLRRFLALLATKMLHGLLSG